MPTTYDDLTDGPTPEELVLYQETAKRNQKYRDNRFEETFNQMWCGFLPASILIGFCCGATAQEALHAPAPLVATALFGPVFLKGVDFIMVLSKPMTDEKAAKTNKLKISLAACVPGLQTASRIWGKKSHYKLVRHDKV